MIRKLVLIDGQTCKEPGGSDVCLPFEQKLGASIELFAESAGRFLVLVTHADGVYVTNHELSSSPKTGEEENPKEMT